MNKIPASQGRIVAINQYKATLECMSRFGLRDMLVVSFKVPSEQVDVQSPKAEMVRRILELHFGQEDVAQFYNQYC